MKEKRIAQKLADLFADSRINEIELAHQTAILFSDTIEDKATSWLAWHNATKNFQPSPLEQPAINLEEYE
jgi:hypothetical protein